SAAEAGRVKCRQHNLSGYHPVKDYNHPIPLKLGLSSVDYSGKLLIFILFSCISTRLSDL
ncbi:hypothetical protein, partial [Salmonella enterica]|uniref:hypothetical protein n=1 Tax=Salmonella enterica TaxID=28901 RepID=UPI0021097465